MPLIFRIALSILLTILPAAAAGQGKVKLHGKVTDANNDPVEFATVRIGGTATGTTTSLEGDYTLTCAKADTIVVYFSCIGFREVKKTLIDPQEDVALNVLLPMDTELLQQVEVVELKKQTGSVDRLDIKDIKRSPDASGG
ncbi:MAG: carboxypeptidase-like regulatory domain-containing protein, partial [Duncaniella sp.]|nr:carboxypeptidase-like regulatory domain-containing protein [Duncaniella sp.]